MTNISLFADYTMTNLDICAQIMIETSFENDIPVKMDEICVKQHQLLCLLDQSQWLNDDVSTPYWKDIFSHS